MPQNFLWEKETNPSNPMEGKGKNEQLIDKLIKKRKQENDAFKKLLNAIENKTTPNEKEKPEGKNKP